MIRFAMFAILLATNALGDWPTYHGDATLKGVSAAALPAEPTLVWRFNAGGAVYNTPVSDGRRIYFAAKKGQLIALDSQGSRVWKNEFTRKNGAGEATPLRFEAPLLAANGLVVAAATSGALHALDGKSGEPKWSVETDGIFLGSPNLAGDALVMLDQSAGALIGIDLQNGKQRWKTEGVERCDGSPGVGDGRIVFGSCLAALHVYAADGKHLRDIEVGGDGQIAGGVVVDGASAFAGARDGALVRADLEKGDIVWACEESEQQSFGTPAVTDELVIYSSDDGFVRAVKKSDGALVWQFETEGYPTSPVVADDKVVVSADGVLYLLALADGTKSWSKEISDEITSPAIIDGLIVVGADDGTVSAWGSPRGVRDSNGDEP